MEERYRRGHSGNAIEKIQRRLADLGFDPGPLDGIFGPLTLEAVRQFQESRSLAADGVVGPQTWGLLFPQDERSRVASTPAGLPEASVFVCYRREDSADVVGRIYDHLAERFGRNAVFKDVDSIPLGVNYRDYLADRISACDILLVVVGRSWLSCLSSSGERRVDQPTDFVRIEVEAALERGIPIIPVLVQGARMPGEDELPAAIRGFAYHQGLPVRPDPDFRHDIQSLIQGIAGTLK